MFLRLTLRLCAFALIDLTLRLIGARVIITRRWGAVQLRHQHTMGESDASLLPHAVLTHAVLTHAVLNHAVS